jgi:hypothetical protein
MNKTYLDIRNEFFIDLTLLKSTINIKEYLSPKYFRSSFISEINTYLETSEGCNCKPVYLTKEQFQMQMLDIILQYKHRDDIKEAIEMIFNWEFGSKLLQ